MLVSLLNQLNKIGHIEFLKTITILYTHFSFKYGMQKIIKYLFIVHLLNFDYIFIDYKWFNDNLNGIYTEIKFVSRNLRNDISYSE